MNDKAILVNKIVVPIGESNVEFLRWANWFENQSNKIVKQECVTSDGTKGLPVGNNLVSTVFLGMNHNLGGSRGNRDLWFETMVFASPDTGRDIYCNRYEAWDEALAGHNETVEKLKAGTLETYDCD